ncbi:acetoin utilization protein AcuC [Isoptericola sp. b441]|uniref:Acetoin utilization protein AcuC n=1 Tax=Actinotalea lenta TaxID=3064654 RepID=A0ABT9DBA6_9CELL|nr:MULTISPECIES: acetoin utilization protein AcuC [unclassified Isoptericola]MDO8106483.1 acetoin utilization protein AcuC [Isoptericola sp. b441]MDO8121801.1 acetoin utilization protein AcuC [Isoptericola sp. b490]
MRVRVVWATELLGYDFGPHHPMAPLRLEMTWRLAGDLGLVELDQVELVGAEPASDATIERVHTADYVAAVRRAGSTLQADPAHGLGTEDNPVFAGMHEAAARIVGASVDQALAVWRGDADHAVNLAGGMHHAMADHASGFCLYNDAAAAISALLDAGARRVAYVDVDAHHGDGVERTFWDDPRVLTCSIHESGHSLFPGTGHPGDHGGPSARGHAVNVPLPAGTSDAKWLRAVESVVPALVRRFAPDVVVSQHGCDAHALDPLTNLAVSIDAQRRVQALVHDLAHEVAGGRWLALGGGGYAVARVVPRVWTHLIGIAAHAPVPLDAPVPEVWREAGERVFGFPMPTLMGEGSVVRVRDWSEGYDPADDVDRAILAARNAAFAWHDLDPLYD